MVGPDQLKLNESKPVFEPGPHQVLGRVEVVGLCFSDLKLLKQFSGHARKSPVVSGIDPQALAEMPHYVPDDKPTVPGHETVVRIVQVGPGVTRHKVGDRYLVQTDYRWLPTASSASAFGYNFEGALQEYVLMDERVVTAPNGESMLIPVPEDFSASALALCEPWACVEDAYVDKQRQKLKTDGKMLVVGETKVAPQQLDNLFARYGKPSDITWKTAAEIGDLKDASFDDVVYFGANADTVAKLFPKVGVRGLFNIVQCGGKFGRLVVSQVGRVHYGAIRVIGTTGSDPAEAMSHIPATAEIRAGDKINIIGAAGPMGTMHVIRDICQGVPDVTVFAGDLSDERLAMLRKLAAPLAQKTQGLASHLQSLEGEARRAVRLHRPHGARPGAGGAIGGVGGQARDHQHLRRHPGQRHRGAGPRCLHREAALLHRHQRLDARRYEAGAGQSAGAPARHQPLRRRRVRPRRRHRRHPGGGEEPGARQDPRLSVLPRPEGDAVDRAGRQASAAGRLLEQAG